MLKILNFITKNNGIIYLAEKFSKLRIHIGKDIYLRFLLAIDEKRMKDAGGLDWGGLDVRVAKASRHF